MLKQVQYDSIDSTSFRGQSEISDKQSLVSECVVCDNEMKPTTAMSAKKFQEVRRTAWA